MKEKPSRCTFLPEIAKSPRAAPFDACSAQVSNGPTQAGPCSVATTTPTDNDANQAKSAFFGSCSLAAAAAGILLSASAWASNTPSISLLEIAERLSEYDRVKLEIILHSFPTPEGYLNQKSQQGLVTLTSDGKVEFGFGVAEIIDDLTGGKLETIGMDRMARVCVICGPRSD